MEPLAVFDLLRASSRALPTSAWLLQGKQLTYALPTQVVKERSAAGALRVDLRFVSALLIMRASRVSRTKPLTAVYSALTALMNPTRADAVAALGETTGVYALGKMHARMEADEVVR